MVNGALPPAFIDAVHDLGQRFVKLLFSGLKQIGVVLSLGDQAAQVNGYFYIVLLRAPDFFQGLQGRAQNGSRVVSGIRQGTGI